jgi:hypothetical protein
MKGLRYIAGKRAKNQKNPTKLPSFCEFLVDFSQKPHKNATKIPQVFTKESQKTTKNL